MEKRFGKPQTLGWIALAISTLISCFWAYWGIIENFHEGWYYDSWLFNVGLMFTQYLSPMLLFIAAALISIFWPRLGGILHGMIALLAISFFDAFSNAASFLIILPLIGLGLMYWFGRPQPRRLAAIIGVSFPLAILILAGIWPVMRVSQRVDDGNLDIRYVEGNGIGLYWAPDGPGWPKSGGNWQEAQQACKYLSQDGLALAVTPQNVWRLPSVDEAVRSMANHGQNSLGLWRPETAEAIYVTMPDKESPLWNIHSQVIYWWTATEVDAEHAYIIAYDGQVWPRLKTFGPDYLGYRCVK